MMRVIPGEAGSKSSLQSVRLRLLITAVLVSEDVTLKKSSLVDLIESSPLFHNLCSGLRVSNASVDEKH